MNRKFFTTFVSAKEKANTNNLMQIKSLQELFNLQLFQSNGQNVLNTGNDLVTELCPKSSFPVFFCPYRLLLISFNLLYFN